MPVLTLTHPLFIVALEREDGQNSEMHQLFRLSVTWVALFAASCASPGQKNVQTVDLDHASPDSGYLLLDIYIHPGKSQDVKDFGCDLVFKEVTVGRTYSIHAPSKASTALIPMEPGTYVFSDVFCSARAKGLLQTSEGRRKKIETGSITYGGLLVVGSLEADKNERTRVSDNLYAKSKRTIQTALGKLKPGQKLIAGTSGREITPKIAREWSFVGKPRFRAKSRGHEKFIPVEVDPDDEKRAEECRKRELMDNDVPMGEYAVTAECDGRGLCAGNLKRVGEHVLTEEFTACADTALRKFRAPYEPGTQVRLSY
jgi:hypothetical protein